MKWYDLPAALGLVPVTWLAFRYWRGAVVSVAAWTIAVAFWVSFLADMAVRAHHDWQWVVSPVYLVSQGTLMAGALLAWPTVLALVLPTLVAAGIVAMLAHGAEGPDILLHTVAFGTIAGLALQRTRYRSALLVGFGVGLVAWWAYCASPSMATWAAYQSCRALAVVLFCAVEAR